MQLTAVGASVGRKVGFFDGIALLEGCSVNGSVGLGVLGLSLGDDDVINVGLADGPRLFEGLPDGNKDGPALMEG